MKRNVSESWTNNGHIRKSHALMGKQTKKQHSLTCAEAAVKLFELRERVAMFLPTAASQYASGGTRHHCTKPQIYSWWFKDLNTHGLNIHSLASPYFSIMSIKTPFYPKKRSLAFLKKRQPNKRLFLYVLMGFYSIPVTPPSTSYCPAICQQKSRSHPCFPFHVCHLSLSLSLSL